MRTVLSTARSSLAATRGVLTQSRGAIAAYRMPLDVLAAGSVVNFWDFRTGAIGTKSRIVRDLVGAHDVNFLGGSVLDSIYSPGAYYVDLEASSSDYFSSNMRRVSNSSYTQITVASWVKLETLGTENTMMAQWRSATGGRGFRLYTGASNKLNLAVSNNGNSTTIYTSDAAAISDTNWHHVVATYRAGTTTCTMYVDGVLVANSLTSGSAPAQIFNPNVQLFLGAASDASSAPITIMDGMLGISCVATAQWPSGYVSLFYGMTRKIMGV